MVSMMRIRWLKKFCILLFLFCLCALPITKLSAETTACRKVYREGGAMAVVRSPDCPRWGQSFSWDPTVLDCSEAMLHSLRHYFTNDHIFCDVNVNLPYPADLNGVQKEANFGIVAAFDGLTNYEDSEMAWKFLQDLFFLNIYFLFDGTQVGRLEGTLPDNFDSLSHVNILKEALLRTINDVDLKFSENGYRATVILVVDDQIFLTSLDGSDERVQEGAAGRYNSWLAASRSVCDVSFERLGIVSPFEVININLLSSNSSCLEATSNVRLKRSMSRGLCDALWETYLHEKLKVFSSCVCVQRFHGEHQF